MALVAVAAIALLLLGFGERYGIAAILCLFLGIYEFLSGYTKWKGIHGPRSHIMVLIYGKKQTWELSKQIGLILIAIGFFLIFL